MPSYYEFLIRNSLLSSPLPSEVRRRAVSLPIMVKMKGAVGERIFDKKEKEKVSPSSSTLISDTNLYCIETSYQRDIAFIK